MTISRRNIIVATAAALAAVPALPKPATAGDEILLDAVARWRAVDQKLGELQDACDQLHEPILQQALARFGFPRDAATQARYLAWVEQEEALSGCHDAWLALNAADEAWHAGLDAIAAAPARSPHGLLAKARLVQLEFERGHSDYGEALAASLASDLQRLAGGAS